MILRNNNTFIQTAPFIIFKMLFNDTLLQSIDRLLADSEKKCFYKSEQNVKKRRRVFEYVLENEKPSIGIGHEVQGDIELRLLRKCGRAFKMTAQQLRIFTLFTQSQIPFIYKDEFEANELRIKEENEVDEFSQYALVCMARRMGKTYITSIFAACLLVSVRDSQVVVYSPGQRQSRMMMDLIRKHLLKLKALVDWTTVPGKDNKEELAICVNGNIRTITGLPAKEETTRGSTATCAICEEAAVMPPSFFVNVVLPVTGPRRTSCLCISTIRGDSVEGDQHWYTKLLNLIQPDGKSFFAIYRSIRVCQACLDSGQENTCNHTDRELPWWHDAAKQNLLMYIMKQLGFADSAAQELQGISKSKLQPMFNTKNILKLFNPTLVPPFDLKDLREVPTMVFTAIDPSLGGEKSRTAVLSTLYHHGRYILIGGESIVTHTSADYIPVIKNHLHTIRLQPNLENVPVVVCIENNLSLVVRELGDALREDPTLAFIRLMRKSGADITHSTLYEGGSVVYGKRTQGKQGEGNVKEEMSYALQRTIENEQLVFSKTFFTVTPNLDVEKYKLGLKEQMAAFSVKLQVSESEFMKPKRTYSAKHVGPDDDVIALALNVHHSAEYRQRPR